MIYSILFDKSYDQVYRFVRININSIKSHNICSPCLQSDCISFCIVFVDINECENGSHDCNENATCVNTAGHFKCSCNKGFKGDGKTCSGIIYVLLYNLVHVYKLPSDFISFCIVQLGIDECQDGSHDCNEDATCVNTAGHFNCSCNNGFSGDGKTCSGRVYVLLFNLVHFDYSLILFLSAFFVVISMNAKMAATTAMKIQHM